MVLNPKIWVAKLQLKDEKHIRLGILAQHITNEPHQIIKTLLQTSLSNQ